MRRGRVGGRRVVAGRCREADVVGAEGLGDVYAMEDACDSRV